MAALICALSSYKEKYQWPDAGATKLETSSVSLKEANPCSKMPRISLFSFETE